MFGIEGELNRDRSLILDRPPGPYCGSSFSSWIGAFDGEPRLPRAGGEFGPESGVPVAQSVEKGRELARAFASSQQVAPEVVRRYWRLLVAGY